MWDTGWVAGQGRDIGYGGFGHPGGRTVGSHGRDIGWVVGDWLMWRLYLLSFHRSHFTHIHTVTHMLAFVPVRHMHTHYMHTCQS